MGDPLTLTLCVEGSAPQGCPVVGECGDPPRGHMPPLGAFARWSGGGGAASSPARSVTLAAPPPETVGVQESAGSFLAFWGPFWGRVFCLQIFNFDSFGKEESLIYLTKLTRYQNLTSIYKGRNFTFKHRCETLQQQQTRPRCTIKAHNACVCGVGKACHNHSFLKKLPKLILR